MTSKSNNTRDVTSHVSTGRQLKVEAVCEELDITPRTFYEWRAKNKAPRCIKLPNGKLRVRRADLDSWIAAHYEEVA
jgi:predicted DNA-binding transcriptional regulator AlpA